MKADLATGAKQCLASSFRYAAIARRGYAIGNEEAAMVRAASIGNMLTGIGHSFSLSAYRAYQGALMQWNDLTGNTAALEQNKRDFQLAQHLQEQSTPKIDNTLGRWASDRSRIAADVTRLGKIAVS